MLACKPEKCFIENFRNTKIARASLCIFLADSEALIIFILLFGVRLEVVPGIAKSPNIQKAYFT